MAAKRTSVPLSIVRTPGASSGLDELVGADAPRLDLIPLDRIDPHPDNPRRDVGDVTELAADIAANGLDQALVVVPHPDEPGRYWATIGHRRRAGSLLAGLTAVPCRIRDDLTPAQQRQMMVRENVHRADLTAVEEADAYQAMLDIDGLTVGEIATAVSRSESTVRSRLRIAKLPEPARDAVHTHRATLEDAAALAEFADDPDLHDALADQLGTDNFTYKVGAARRARVTAALFEPFLRRLRKANATELKADPNGWSSRPPEGMHFAGQMHEHLLQNGSENEDVKAFAAKIASVTAGWSYRRPGGSLYLFRPPTLEEAQAAADRDEREAAAAARRAEVDAERQAEVAARKEREAANAELVSVSAETRREFLKGLIGKKLTAAQISLLLEFTGRALFDEWIGWIDTPTAWLDVDPDAIAAQAQADERDADDAIDEATTAALAALAPANRLLVALATGIEPIRNVWDLKAAAGRAWYALLEHLGYPVSDAERTALAGEVS